VWGVRLQRPEAGQGPEGSRKKRGDRDISPQPGLLDRLTAGGLETPTQRVPRLTPVIPATQEAKIRRIAVQSQPGQVVCETRSRKKKVTKKGWRSGSR
jgi:hypothetical protein